MLQLSLPSLDVPLLVRDAHGRYLRTSADDTLEAARHVIDQKVQRGARFDFKVANVCRSAKDKAAKVPASKIRVERILTVEAESRSR
jgi:hypothetical protein